MICRRGGIGKQDIGAIRIYSDRSPSSKYRPSAAEIFAAKIKGPDKEEAIRIVPLPGGPRGRAMRRRRRQCAAARLCAKGAHKFRKKPGFRQAA